LPPDSFFPPRVVRLSFKDRERREREREREREEGREAEEKSRDVVGLRVYLFTNETMLEHARTI
jgi:hypothetical protein